MNYLCEQKCYRKVNLHASAIHHKRQHITKNMKNRTCWALNHAQNNQTIYGFPVNHNWLLIIPEMLSKKRHANMLLHNIV